MWQVFPPPLLLDHVFGETAAAKGNQRENKVEPFFRCWTRPETLVLPRCTGSRNEHGDQTQMFSHWKQVRIGRELGNAFKVFAFILL